MYSPLGAEVFWVLVSALRLVCANNYKIVIGQKSFLLGTYIWDCKDPLGA